MSLGNGPANGLFSSRSYTSLRVFSIRPTFTGTSSDSIIWPLLRLVLVEEFELEFYCSHQTILHHFHPIAALIASYWAIFLSCLILQHLKLLLVHHLIETKPQPALSVPT